jgi:hypothetical protein
MEKEINNSTLDSTLRYLYSTVRYTGCELMAIEFKHRGTVWRADTPEEAVALRNQLEKSDKVYVPAHEEMDKSSALWTPDKFMDVINGVGDLQQRLLVAIYRKPKITSKELVQVLGIASEVALAGIISGLSKQVKQLGIDPNQVFSIEVKWTGKTKTRRFILDDFFLHAGMEQNWPDAWEGSTKKGDRNAPSTKRKRK